MLPGESSTLHYSLDYFCVHKGIVIAFHVLKWIVTQLTFNTINLRLLSHTCTNLHPSEEYEQLTTQSKSKNKPKETSKKSTSRNGGSSSPLLLVKDQGLAAGMGSAGTQVKHHSGCC